ncbi:unnamed protein product [Auanema sp. JU1783]|nr:unnamed protein product [Auanema sp. JU1783]
MAADGQNNTNSLYMLLTHKDRRDDLMTVIVWLIMLLYALISNILIIVGVLRSAAMRCATSYWFIISLAICDIVMVFISLIHLIPSTAFHEDFVHVMSTRNVVMLFFYNFFWYTGVVQLGLMAFNRFVSIVYPMEYKVIFSRQRSCFLLLLGYFLGFLASLPTLFSCCHLLWDAHSYATIYVQPDTWYKYVDMGVNSISLLMMLISYAAIIHKVRESGRAVKKYQLSIRMKQSGALVVVPPTCPGGFHRTHSFKATGSQVSKKELRLFIQFFLVSIVFLLTWTTWQWLPRFFQSKGACFAMTSLFFINNSVNPTVYLIFNTQLRRELYKLFCIRG